MKYLLFDQSAIETFVSRNVFQSIEYVQGKELVEHFCGTKESGLLEDVYIEHNNEGVLFVGKKKDRENDSKDKGEKV